jgi:AcrR family transcriptional regulator
LKKTMASGAADVNKTRRPSRTRQKIVDAAYKLFTRNPISAVGVDTVTEQAGVAKMSLYRHFTSKEDLILAVLARREELWTVQWLEAESLRRSRDPEGRLLALFEVLDEWFHKRNFEGCTFIKMLLEADPKGSIHAAAASHLAGIRAILSRRATDAALADADHFAQTWHILMLGSIVAASEGNREAGKCAKSAGLLLLKTWPRAEPASVSPVPGGH